MKQIHRLWAGIRATVADARHYFNRTGPYAPRERNPGTIETIFMPAQLKARHGKVYPPLFTRRVVIAVVLAAILALTIATMGVISSRKPPVPVCARYGRNCAPTPEPTHAPDSVNTPKGQ